MFSATMANHMAVNAACISQEYDFDSYSGLLTTLSAYDEIATAAETLARIEAERPDFWEYATNDWESVCSCIAIHIFQHGVAPARSDIRGFIDDGE